LDKFFGASFLKQLVNLTNLLLVKRCDVLLGTIGFGVSASLKLGLLVFLKVDLTLKLANLFVVHVYISSELILSVGNTSLLLINDISTCFQGSESSVGGFVVLGLELSNVELISLDFISLSNHEVDELFFRELS